MRDNAITPQVIKTQEEADRITREQRELLNNPNARQWNIGDEYYLGGIDLGIEHKTTK